MGQSLKGQSLKGQSLKGQSLKGQSLKGQSTQGHGLAVEQLVVTYGADPGATPRRTGGDGAGRRRDSTGTTAVDQVDLHVAEGEVLAILGPSGCGKSSLLRAVAGLEPVAGGRVLWDGADVAQVPVHRRGFGLMFQDGQLFAHKDVAGNVEYGLRMQRVPRAQRRARVTELLDVVGLPGSESRSVATMSGGERQRVALARALAPQPGLLLLDEPLSALDRALRERLATDLRAALVETGTTALFVTHDHDEAFTVADRVAVMSHGRLLQVDTPARLWAAPADRQVAEFLGYQAFVPDAGLGPGPAPDTGPRSWTAVGPEGLVLGDPSTARWTATVLSTTFRRGAAEISVATDLGDGPVRCTVRSGTLRAGGADGHHGAVSAVSAGGGADGDGGDDARGEVDMVPGTTVGLDLDPTRTAHLPA